MIQWWNKLGSFWGDEKKLQKMEVNSQGIAKGDSKFRNH